MPDDSELKYMKKVDSSPLCLWRMIVIFIVPITAYTLGAAPTIVSLLLIIRYLNLYNPLHLLIFMFLLTIEFIIFIISETLIPGLFLKILRFKPKEGEYPLSLRDKTFYRCSLFYLLYRPPLKLIAIFNLIPLHVLFLRLAGLQIGKTSTLPGTELITDPYLTEIGERTLVGGFSTITAHLIEHNLLLFKKITIGNDCLIGGFTLIMPGAIIDNNVTLGAKSLVTKNKHLYQGKRYGGIPAKEIP